jgi:SAM-dependent methyltransferase
MIISKCSICDSKELETTKRGLYCKFCGSNIANYLPDDNEINEYYRKFNEEFTSGGRINNREDRANTRALYYFEVLKRYFSNPKTLIDIGCSNSPFPNIASYKGLAVSAADYIKPKNLSEKIFFFTTSIDSIKWNSIIKSSFDVVTLFDVMEHCRYPKVAAENIASTVKKGGIVIITTPLSNSFGERNALGTTRWLFPPEHLNIFSKKGMDYLMFQHGFEALYFEKFDYTLIRKALRNGYGVLLGVLGLMFKFLNKKIWIESKRTSSNKVQDIGLYVYRKL